MASHQRRAASDFWRSAWARSSRLPPSPDSDSAWLSISETEGVCGGYPCLGDTRIPVRVLVNAYRQFDDFERVVSAFPQLSREQIRYALDWYIKHPDRVEEDIRTNREALQER